MQAPYGEAGTRRTGLEPWRCGGDAVTQASAEDRAGWVWSREITESGASRLFPPAEDPTGASPARDASGPRAVVGRPGSAGTVTYFVGRVGQSRCCSRDRAAGGGVPDWSPAMEKRKRACGYVLVLLTFMAVGCRDDDASPQSEASGSRATDGTNWSDNPDNPDNPGRTTRDSHLFPPF